MLHYFAPMEGLTDHIYRRLHHEFFPGLDRYYMPFISPTIHRTLTNRENRDLPMADSVDFIAIPQILTKVPEDFIWAACQCADRGYTEVNLNVGCPSGTVTAKGKGAGMLADPDHLDRFLDEILAGSPIPVSVKTRLGIHNPEEFPRLLEIYNRYPLKELIVHPRVRAAFYNGSVEMETFDFCYQSSKNPLCLNGNLSTAQDIAAIEAHYPGLNAVMIGRGLIGDPGMLTSDGSTAEKLEAFHGALLDAYRIAFGSARNAMFRLKENWRFMIRRFEGGEKLLKRLRKTTDLEEYRAITSEIFHTLPLAPALQPDW